MRFRVLVALLVIAMIAAVLSVSAVCAQLWWEIANPAPMSGYVEGKNCFPSSYPVDWNTQMVHVLQITSPYGERSMGWVVDEETWNMHSVGDYVEKGWR